MVVFISDSDYLCNSTDCLVTVLCTCCNNDISFVALSVNVNPNRRSYLCVHHLKVGDQQKAKR